MKKKFYIIKNRLKIRIGMLLIATVLFMLCSISYDAHAQTYETLPAYHKQNVSFMRCNNMASMNTLLFRYELGNEQTLIGFGLLYNIALCLVMYAGGLTIVSIYQFINWHERYAFDKHFEKLAKYSDARFTLQKGLNTSE